jgi:hypothetical protein
MFSKEISSLFFAHIRAQCPSVASCEQLPQRILFQVIMSQRVCMFFVPGYKIDENFSRIKNELLGSEAQPKAELQRIHYSLHKYKFDLQPEGGGVNSERNYFLGSAHSSIWR